jgi:hypothetical protein
VIRRISGVRIVGRRTSTADLEPHPSAAALRRGLDVVDAAATFGWAASTGQRKGVYRFPTFEAMEQHRIDSLARAMAEVAARRAR